MPIETAGGRDGGSTAIMYTEALFYIFLLQHPPVNLHHLVICALTFSVYRHLADLSACA